MTSSDRNRAKGAARKPLTLIGVAVVIVAALVTIVWLKAVRGGEEDLSMLPTVVARRGPLTISVLEAGAMKALEREVIRNEVEGRSSIISIVSEGTYVRAGDLLAELDVSTLKDRQIDQEIQLQTALAAFINAEETLAITENQAASDVELAELTLKFAEQDLTKYLEGQYRNELIAAQNRVEEANEVLTRAKETLKWSETLYAEKYISETELLADRLAETRGKNSLTVAQNELDLLERYTKQRQVDQLTSDVNQAKMALERTNRKASANVVQAKAQLNAREQSYKREEAKLKKIEDQIAKATVRSPVDGMVVYATSSRGGFGRDDRRPLADGVEVWERQELIYIPKSASAVAEVDIHEASLEKVRLGQPAIVTVDAIPDGKFIGTVARIAPLPNAQSMWMNPDLKVYTTNINLDTSDPRLRSGMSCRVEIIVKRYDDVVYIPVWSVIRVKGQPTVYVIRNGRQEPRPVEIGLDDNNWIAILSGLSKGEVVLMTPPLEDAAMEPGARIPGADDANDPMSRSIDEKLRAVGDVLPGEGRPPMDESGRPGIPDANALGPEGQGGQMLSTEQMQQMRERYESMTPEERRQEMERMRRQFEYYQSVREEERQQVRPGRGEGRAEDASDSAGRGQGGGGRGGRTGVAGPSQERGQ